MALEIRAKPGLSKPRVGQLAVCSRRKNCRLPRAMPIELKVPSRNNNRHLRGLIVNLVVSPQDKETIIALLTAQGQYLSSRGCCVIRCYVNQKSVQEALLACGFMPRPPHMRFLVSRKIEGLEAPNNLSGW